MTKRKADPEKPLPAGTDPREVMRATEADRFDDAVFDSDDRQLWARAMIDGGLPYMWRKAHVVLDMIYGLCGLREGSRVFLIGEALERCGFCDDIRARIGPTGTLTAVDIGEESRAALDEGRIGRDGRRGTFRYDHCGEIADSTHDAVLNLQAVRCADDWTEAGAELLRILKPGGRLVMAEIVLGGAEQRYKVRQDLFLDYLVAKVTSGIGTRLEDFPHHSLAGLEQAFAGQMTDIHAFEWRGLEVFSGRKPDA